MLTENGIGDYELKTPEDRKTCLILHFQHSATLYSQRFWIDGRCSPTTPGWVTGSPLLSAVCFFTQLYKQMWLRINCGCLYVEEK